MVIIKEHKLNTKEWNLSIQIDKVYNTWYSYRFKKFYCAEHIDDGLCSYITQDDYLQHMSNNHNKTYMTEWTIPQLPSKYIIIDDRLIVNNLD